MQLPPNTTNVLTHSIVELRINCRNLRNMDMISKSDPQVIVYEHNPVRTFLNSKTNAHRAAPQRQPTITRQETFWTSVMGPSNSSGWNEIGRTEVLYDNLNPKFVTKITTPFIFEETQLLRFVVIDIDGNSTRIEDHDLLGVYETNLSSIITANGRSVMKPLQHPKKKTNNGYIMISATEVTENRMNVKLHFAGRKLDKKDFFGKSDPFFVINRGIGLNNVAVYQSEVIRKTLDPNWNPFNIAMNDLCGGNNPSVSLIIDVFDWDAGKEPDYIGSATTSLAQLLDSLGSEIPLVNSKRKKSPVAGYLRILNSAVERIPTFLDYIAGGTEINVAVAIDFTGSNGDPRDSSSLHHIYRDGRYNDYQKAIKAVGGILEAYDKDKLCPVLGFGAVCGPRTRLVSHCFPLNGNENDPSVFGVQGILDVYSEVLPRLGLAGPTNFAPTIDLVSTQIRSSLDDPTYNTYTFLLILTDGEISDMQETTDAIVLATDLPLSIVIVGIGNSNFANMDKLDADNEPLRHSSGRIRAKRDIVQFVPFSKFRADSIGDQLLAKEVLAEIPDQLTGYYKSKGILPKPPRAPSVTSNMSLPRSNTTANEITNEDNVFITFDDRNSIATSRESLSGRPRREVSRSQTVNDMIQNLPPPYSGPS
ncbi:Copine-8 [Nowakowskiella sp. JEL0407]|nr:Copine-8 [Nowakowskiella sp. JEL0407]